MAARPVSVIGQWLAGWWSFYILATSKIILWQMRLVVVRSHGDFTVLPHWETNTMTWYLTQSQRDTEPTSPCHILEVTGLNWLLLLFIVVLRTSSIYSQISTDTDLWQYKFNRNFIVETEALIFHSVILSWQWANQSLFPFYSPSFGNGKYQVC